MHVDHDRGRSISLGKPFLRQDEVQQIGATAAEFLWDGHVEVTGGLHRLDILEGEAVLTVMPSSAGLEILGVECCQLDKPLLPFDRCHRRGCSFDQSMSS